MSEFESITADADLCRVFVPMLTADLEHVADLFDRSFWPLETFDADGREDIAALIERAPSHGTATTRLAAVALRFGIESRVPVCA
jgi:hypothetical protein